MHVCDAETNKTFESSESEFPGDSNESKDGIKTNNKPEIKNKEI